MCRVASVYFWDASLILGEMDLSTLANLVNAFAVTAALIFAAAQIGYYRQRRRRDAMLELVRSFQSPAFTSALRRVLSLPDGADTQKIREVLGPDGEDAVYLVSLTWESIGLLLFRRELTLEMVDDFFSGPILLSWKKLRVWAEEWRRTLNRETGSEWFHWLAERMIEREKISPPVPAYIAHRDWREPRRRLAKDGSAAPDPD
jgi:hypothetical protein